MYSGTTLTKYSGRVMGAHQKIDRVARRHLRVLIPRDKVFPGIRMILQFEGKNGPDGIKRKSPAQDEPWHYIDPFDPNDTKLTDIIQHHYSQLVFQLRQRNSERSAFEAAWLAHALVDGLTPAHHYPYEKELMKLRGGAALESRNTITKKLVIPGDTIAEMIANNWKMWGGKGLMTTHGTFEWGVASMIKPLSLKLAAPSADEIAHIQQHGVVNVFREYALDIAKLNMYEAYYRHGWTSRLANQVRTLLTPTVIRMVTLAWYAASQDATQQTEADILV